MCSWGEPIADSCTELTCDSELDDVATEPEMPQPQRCLGFSDSVSVDFAQNRPNSTALHPPKRQQGAINRFRFFSASPLLCQMWFDLLSKLGPLSRIWQETCMSQHQSMHLNRILDNVAPGTAMKYISSCTFFFKT